MNKIAVVMLAGDKQNECFWPSYYNCDEICEHDLIIVHRDNLGLPNDIQNKNGNIILLNKIVNGLDIPHKAFGGYRYAFQTYRTEYDYFIFISDDVVLKRNYWLTDIITTLNKHEKLGFGGSQIFNGGRGYPHESHVRAPFWFAKTKALNETVWEFNSDHDGEMRIGDQITQAGYFGVQIGSKIDLGYDVFEPFHISQLIEQKYFPNQFPNGKYDLKNYFNDMSEELISDFIISPYSHIGKQNVIIDLQPFDGLIYLPSLEIAKQSLNIIDKGYNTYTI